MSWNVQKCQKCTALKKTVPIYDLNYYSLIAQKIIFIESLHTSKAIIFIHLWSYSPNYPKKFVYWYSYSSIHMNIRNIWTWYLKKRPMSQRKVRSCYFAKCKVYRVKSPHYELTPKNVYLLVYYVPFIANGAVRILHRAINRMTDQKIYFLGWTRFVHTCLGLICDIWTNFL